MTDAHVKIKTNLFIANGIAEMLLGVLCMLASACTSTAQFQLAGTQEGFAPGAIVATATGQSVTFDELVAQLSHARVIYIGERHSEALHHAHQLAVIEALHARVPNLKIGLEMIDHTYQPVLDRWTQGESESAALPRLTHWEANWGFAFALYAEILEFARAQRIPIIALNLPFHIPPKIAIGGLKSLTAEDRAHLPAHIDLERTDHRAFVEGIFQMHRGMRAGQRDFNDFYAAQCVWEDTMAEAVARHLGTGSMVVLAGNGHIQNGFGIPLRAQARGAAPYRSVIQLPAGTQAEPTAADFIWVTSLEATGR